MTTWPNPGAYQCEMRVVAAYLDDGGASVSSHVPHCPRSGGLGGNVQQMWSHF